MSKTLDNRVTEIVQSGDLTVLTSECENLEIEYLSDRDVKPSSFFYAAFMLSYLIDNDLDNCRFLWKRLTKELKKGETESVWKIGKALWKKDYPATYQAVNVPWNQQLKPLVDAFVVALRTRVLRLVANAYTNISSAALAEKLGQSEQEAEQLATGYGFQYDAGSKYFTPNKQALEAQLETNKKSGLDTISSLAKKTLFLELN